MRAQRVVQIYAVANRGDIAAVYQTIDASSDADAVAPLRERRSRIAADAAILHRGVGTALEPYPEEGPFNGAVIEANALPAQEYSSVHGLRIRARSPYCEARKGDPVARMLSVLPSWPSPAESSPLLRNEPERLHDDEAAPVQALRQSYRREGCGLVDSALEHRRIES